MAGPAVTASAWEPVVYPEADAATDVLSVFVSPYVNDPDELEPAGIVTEDGANEPLPVEPSDTVTELVAFIGVPSFCSSWTDPDGVSPAWNVVGRPWNASFGPLVQPDSLNDPIRVCQFQLPFETR